VTGIIILIVALAIATALGFLMRARSGKIKSFDRTDSGDSSSASADVSVLTADDLGTPLGTRATLLQMSTEFCTYCGPTRKLLAELAETESGVKFVEIDAAENMELTRRLKVFSTPTVLVLRPDGRIAARSAGQQQKAGLAQSLRSVLDDGVRS
jgi:thiol-disulfide isomerase/thioredoxin